MFLQATTTTKTSSFQPHGVINSTVSDFAKTDRGSCAASPLLHFDADHEIFGEGDHADSFYRVVSGMVRTCKFMSDGRRQIDAFYGPGDFFGLELGAEYSLSAEAVGGCNLVAYRRREYETAATNDPGVAKQLLDYAMQGLVRAQGHARLLGRRTAMEKVATFLLEMTVKKDGDHAVSADKVVDLAMTRQDIADYLGLTIETVSRTFSQLEREGVIGLSTARHIKVLDRAALECLNS